MFIKCELKRFTVVNIDTMEEERFDFIKQVKKYIKIPERLPVAFMRDGSRYLVLDTKRFSYTQKQLAHIYDIHNNAYALVNSDNELVRGFDLLLDFQKYISKPGKTNYSRLARAAEEIGCRLIDVNGRSFKYVAVTKDGACAGPLSARQLALAIGVNSGAVYRRTTGGVNYGERIKGWSIELATEGTLAKVKALELLSLNGFRANTPNRVRKLLLERGNDKLCPWSRKKLIYVDSMLCAVEKSRGARDAILRARRAIAAL